VGDPSLEKLEFSAAYINEEIGDSTSERYRADRRLHRGARPLAGACCSSRSKGAHGFPDGTTSDDLLLNPGVSYSSLPPIS
jgi:hypothetical protein